MISSGSTTFFFDFDIFSTEPMITSSPPLILKALRASGGPSKRTSAGGTQAPDASL